jgi:hypothetical protein
MDYCEDPSRTFEHLNFPAHLTLKRHDAKVITYNERPKMKRDARLKAVFRSGISLHFRVFAVRYGFKKNQATSQNSLG